MRHLIRTAAVLATTLVVTAAAPANAAPDDLSARWLSNELTDGLVHNDQFGFDDYGLTADTAVALAELGGQRDTLRTIRKALAPRVDSWTTGVDFGSSDVYAGSTAKAVVVAQKTGANPRDFGGVNLVHRLSARVSDTKSTAGRLQDRSDTDYANVIGQAFAVQGLVKAGSGKAGTALRFLLKQQCSPGYFRLAFADKDARKQSCDGGDRATTSAPDTDVTALAVLSLQALPRKTSAVRSAIADSVDWLKRKQQRNGSFGGGVATEASNTNSTGLAGWVLGNAGACRPAARAARWVQRLQVSGDVSGTPLAGDKGAIAYDRAALRAAEVDGIGSGERDQFRRATTQAAPALANLSVSTCRSR